jgi:hypothetical protein
MRSGYPQSRNVANDVRLFAEQEDDLTSILGLRLTDIDGRLTSSRF